MGKRRGDVGSPEKTGVTNIRKITIGKGEKIETNAYILTFNRPQVLKEVKIGYCFWRGSNSTSQHLWRASNDKNYREACRGRYTCAKYGEKDPDLKEEDYLKETRCVYCRQNHPAYARSCEANKKEKEMLELKHKRNVSFHGARKIVGTYMDENS